MYAFVAARAWRFETTELAMMQTFSQSWFFFDQSIVIERGEPLVPLRILHHIRPEAAKRAQHGRVRADLLGAQVDGDLVLRSRPNASPACGPRPPPNTS